MRKIIVILMMFFLGAGLTQPTGHIQYFNLQEKYAQCSEEDHDITPLDFVFEHLLNLETIVNFLEGELEYESGDHPHEPFQASQSIAPMLIILPDLVQIDLVKNQPLFWVKTKHAILDRGIYLSCFKDDVFRPPIFS